jgi:type I restriction enzyme S subunit
LRAEAAQPTDNPGTNYVGLEHIVSGDPYLTRWGRASDVTSSKSRFYACDVLYGKLRPYLDKAVLAEFDGICSTDILVIQSSESMWPQFLAHLLHAGAFLDYAVKTTRGVNHPRTSWSSLAAFEFSSPPLPEQRAIARALQAVQGALRTRRRELVLERERKAALMQHLFTHGMHGEPRKQTEIGEMPESWQVESFGKIVEIAGGQVNPSREPYAQMIHIGPENIEPGTGRLFAVKTNEDLNIISGNYYFTTEHVLYSKIRPYLNKVALPNFEGTCSADMYPLRPRHRHLTRDYLFQLLLSEQFKLRAMSFQDRTGIPKINRDQLRSILLPVPSVEEQNEIASALSACDTKISSLEREAEILEELFRAMLEELMTGRLSAVPLIDAKQEAVRA